MRVYTNIPTEGTEAEEVGQALVWLICACVGKLRNAIIFFQQGQARSRCSNFKQPLLGSVKSEKCFK